MADLTALARDIRDVVGGTSEDQPDEHYDDQAQKIIKVVTDWLESEDTFDMLLAIVQRNVGRTGSIACTRRLTEALTGRTRP